MQTWTLITGGAKGLGKEIALALAKEGHHIILHYNTSHQEAESVAEQCRKLGVSTKIFQADFMKGPNTLIEAVKKENFHVSYLINNVGNYLVKSALETNEGEWRELIEANLTAPFLLTKAFIETIKTHKGGIINIGVSGLNRFSADIYSSVYMMTKQSLLFLTKSMSKELAPFEVNVNMVSPGHMENSVDKPSDPAKLPMGKLVTLKEVAELVVFLLDPKRRQITGQNIEIAGAVRI